MEADEREPIRGRQARAARARVGRSGPLFSSSSGSSDGEGSTPDVRPGNIEFPPNLVGHYYVRDPTREAGAMMELPITDTQRVPIAILPSPGSASKRPSSLTPSSVATTRNLDMEVGAASPVGSNHQQQHRCQAPSLASPTSSTRSTTSRLSSRAPPPPGYLSNSCYQLGCSPQCPILAPPSRRRTTSPHSYVMAHSPGPSPRSSATSVPYKYYQQPRHSYDAGLGSAGRAGRWRTPPRGGHSPLGHTVPDPAGQLADTAEQLRQQLHLLHQQQEQHQEVCGGAWRQQPQHRAPVPLPPSRPEVGDVALKDWAASVGAGQGMPTRRRARSDGSVSFSGIGRGRPVGPAAFPSQPPVPAHETHCQSHQPSREACAEAVQARTVAAAPPSGDAFDDAPAHSAGTSPHPHAAPRASTSPSLSQQQQPEEQLLRLLCESAARSSSDHPPLRSPRVQDGLQSCLAALSELDSIVGGVGGGEAGVGGSGDGVGLTVGSRSGLYDITTILRRDGSVETVLHINNSRGGGGGSADSGNHAAVPSSRSLPQSPLAATRSGGRHDYADAGAGPSRSPPLAPSSPLRVAINSNSSFLLPPYSVMSELATAAGVPVGATTSPGRANSSITELSSGASAGSPGRAKRSQHTSPLWREAEQAERPPSQHQLLSEETVAAFEKRQQHLQTPDSQLGKPNYSLMANPLFRSYGGASSPRVPSMPDIESASPARLTDDGGAPASGTRTPPSSTRRPMLLLGGPRNSSPGRNSRGSCVLAETASLTGEDLVAAACSLGIRVGAAASEEVDPEEDEDLFSMPMPSPASMRQMRANSDSGGSSGRISPARLLNPVASEGGLGGPSSSGGSGFACSPTRRSSASDGMRVLDLTCLQQQQQQLSESVDISLPAPVTAVAKLVAGSASQEAAIPDPLAGPTADAADAPLVELPSLSPCWMDGIPDSAWDPFLPEPLTLAEPVIPGDAARLRSPSPPEPASLPDPSAAADTAAAVAATSALASTAALADGGESAAAAIPGLPPIPLLSESPLATRRSSVSGSSEREVPIVPVPVILAAATEVQMQGADLMAMARHMERTGDNILAAALEVRRRSEDIMAAAQEARVQSFTLIAEAVNVKMQGADMLAAARIVQLQGADLMVAAAREVEDEEMADLESSGSELVVEAQDEAVQVTAEPESQEMEETAVAPAANAVLAQERRGCADGGGAAAPPSPLMPQVSGDDAPVPPALWPSLEMSSPAGAGAAAVAYVSFPNELTLDINAALSPSRDGEKAWAHETIITVDSRASEALLSGAGSADAAIGASEQQGDGIWQGWAALEGATAAAIDAPPPQQQSEAQQDEAEQARWAQEDLPKWDAVTEAEPETASANGYGELLAVAAAEAAAAVIAGNPSAARAKAVTVAAEAVEFVFPAELAAATSGVAANVLVDSADASLAMTRGEEVSAVVGPAAVEANAQSEAAQAGEVSLTPSEVDELMALALEISAEAMGIRAAEAMRASDGEELALEGLALACAELAPQLQSQEAQVLTPAAAPMPTLCAGAAAGAEAQGDQEEQQQRGRRQQQQEQQREWELQQTRRQEEQMHRAQEAPVAVRAAGQGNAAAARDALVTWDVDVGGDGTALLSLQPRQSRSQLDVAPAAAPGAEGPTHSPKGTDAAAAAAAALATVEPAPAAQPSSGGSFLAVAAASTVGAGAVAATVPASAAAAVSPSVSRLSTAVAKPTSADFAVPAPSSQRSTSISVSTSRFSGRAASCSSPAAGSPASPSTASSSRGKARSKAKVVAAALAGTQAKPATAAVVAPALAATPAAVEATAAVAAPSAASASTAAPTAIVVSAVAVVPSASAVAPEAVMPTVALPSLSCQPTASEVAVPSGGPATDTGSSSSSVVGLQQAKKGARTTAAAAGGMLSGSNAGSANDEIVPAQPRPQQSALAPVGASWSIAAPAPRPPGHGARASTAEADSSAIAAQIPPAPAPTAPACGPVASTNGAVLEPLDSHVAHLVSDDEDSESAGRGGSWLAFGSGLLASAALVCASALQLAQQPQPKPEHGYQTRPFQQQPGHWSTSAAMRLHVGGRTSGSSIDSMEGGMLPLNVSSCPAPWLLRCVPVEVEGAGRRDVAVGPAAQRDEDGDYDGAAGRPVEAAVGEAAEPWVEEVGNGFGDAEEARAEEDDEEQRIALDSLDAAAALMSHPQYVGSGVPAWLSSDPRVVSAELEGQLFAGGAPLLGDGGSEARWDDGAEEEETAPPMDTEELEMPEEEEEELDEAAAAGVETDAKEAAATDKTEEALYVCEGESNNQQEEASYVWEGESSAQQMAVVDASQAQDEAAEEAKAEAMPAIPPSPRRAADFWPVVAAVPDVAVTSHSQALAASTVGATPDAAAPGPPPPAPSSAGTYLRGAGLCLSAVVAATVSALLWAGRRRRVPRSPWMAEWKSVWDVGPIPSVRRNPYLPAGATAGPGAGASPSGLHPGSGGADNGIYDVYGAAVIAAGGAAAYAMHDNADPYGYAAGGAAAPSGSVAFAGPAGFPNFQPTEYDHAYYQQHQNHNPYHYQQQQHYQEHDKSPVSPRRYNRDVAPNAGLLHCYYLRSNRLVPRGSPRSPPQRTAGGSVGGASAGMSGGDGAGAAGAFAAGSDAGVAAAPSAHGQMDVWYHWLRNRTVFCFNQQEMSPEARRLMADQHH